MKFFQWPDYWVILLPMHQTLDIWNSWQVCFCFFYLYIFFPSLGTVNCLYWLLYYLGRIVCLWWYYNFKEHILKFKIVIALVFFFFFHCCCVKIIQSGSLYSNCVLWLRQHVNLTFTVGIICCRTKEELRSFLKFYFVLG